MSNALAIILALSIILLLVHIFMQIILATKELGLDWNMGARDKTPAIKSIIAERAARASHNFRETYPAFLAIVLLANIVDMHQAILVFGALIWFVARCLYLPLYLTGIPKIRTYIWLLSIMGLIIMLVAWGV